MDSSISFVQPLVGLVVTFVILGLVLWGVKALQNKRNIFGSRSIQIIEAASVGTRERVVIADVGGRRLVLGVTAQNVNLLTELDKDVPSVDVSELTGFEAPLPETPVTFKDRLVQSLSNVINTPNKGA
ncbi:MULTISPECIES: flagellar biosynthetic protein FliO [unclassified Marinobacterium]|jgi:flagellar biosynthetic protein FliO|uniref:flagellar biosynthetic protein FliO n=1 Tax=unclassified Marinobacterium TaxID=2644139 RepID=UPI00156A529A|nr:MULTISPECIES: flagellar biosynthetic protein FliO [unclassified Marinobacterium]NRP14438.1 Flagellar protein FliO [Marinobacterium sp. xm-a-152]NRP28671.1 Flagellar protein FliO [Marinobacterium sp. xm-d-420]